MTLGVKIARQMALRGQAAQPHSYPMTEPLRLYILDDHEPVRQALAARLAALPNVEIVGLGADPEAALAALPEAHPDVVLVETKRHDGRGLEIVHWLARNAPGVQLAVLTSYPSEWEMWAARRAGSAAYFLKDINSEQLIERLRQLRITGPAALD